jgi:hypothetical protein
MDFFVFHHYNLTIRLIGITVASGVRRMEKIHNFIVSSPGRTGVYLPGCELLQIIQTEIDKLTAQL